MKTQSTANRKRGKCVKMPPTIGFTPKRRRNSRENQSCQPRTLMRAWLEHLLNNGLCRGLRWVEKASSKFSVDWRHGSSSGFNPSEHSEVFYLWAEHTGKIKRGVGKDHSNNKSAFRCALHSLKDCIDLTKDGDIKGESAKRTFQFIEPGHPEYNSKKRSRCSKNKNEPKEETVAFTPDADEQDSSTLDTEHIIVDQETSTLESQPELTTLDTQQETSIWLYPHTGASTSSSFPSFLLPVEKTHVNTIDVDGDSFITQNTVRNTSSPAAISEAAETASLSFYVVDRTRLVPNFDDLSLPCPCSITQHLVETQTAGVVTLELQEIDVEGENIQMDAVDDSKLPVFSKLGMSDTFEVPFAHLGLNSGGSVKVNKIKQKSWRTAEFQKKQTSLDRTPVATVPDHDDSSSADTGYGSFGNDSVDMNEWMEMNNPVEIEGFEKEEKFTELHHSPLTEKIFAELNHSPLPEEIFAELHHSPLTEESNVDFANIVFTEMTENGEIEVLLLDKQTDNTSDEKTDGDIFLNTPFYLNRILDEYFEKNNDGGYSSGK